MILTMTLDQPRPSPIVFSQWFWFKHSLKKRLNAIGDWLFIGGVLVLWVATPILAPLLMMAQDHDFEKRMRRDAKTNIGGKK